MFTADMESGRIHVTPVHDVAGICDYSAKTLKWHRADESDILILPRSISELRDSRRMLNGEERAIRDIQAAHNVSFEVAERLAPSNRRKAAPLFRADVIRGRTL